MLIRELGSRHTCLSLKNISFIRRSSLTDGELSRKLISALLHESDHKKKSSDIVPSSGKNHYFPNHKLLFYFSRRCKNETHVIAAKILSFDAEG